MLQVDSRGKLQYARRLWYFGLQYALAVMHSDPDFVTAVRSFDPAAPGIEGGLSDSFYFKRLDKLTGCAWSSRENKLDVGYYALGVTPSVQAIARDWYHGMC